MLILIIINWRKEEAWHEGWRQSTDADYTQSSPYGDHSQMSPHNMWKGRSQLHCIPVAMLQFTRMKHLNWYNGCKSTILRPSCGSPHSHNHMWKSGAVQTVHAMRNMHILCWATSTTQHKSSSIFIPFH